MRVGKQFLKLLLLALLVMVSGNNGLAMPPGEYVFNGGFEVGVGADAPPWILNGDGPQRAMITTEAKLAHQGQRFLALGGVANSIQSIFQPILIPETNQPVKFSFWLEIISQEPRGKQHQDILAVNVTDSDGKLLEVIATYSEDDLKKFSHYRRQEFNLAKFKGQACRIEFVAANSALFPTAFHIDDVSVASPDYEISFLDQPLTVAPGTASILFVNIDRVADFADAVTVFAPDRDELKAAGFRIAAKSRTSRRTRVGFSLEISATATAGTYGFTFTAKDERGRARSAVINIIVL